MIYILGIIAVLVSALLHAGANIIDSYLSNKIFKRLANLIFFSSLFNVFFLPLVFLVAMPKAIDFHSLLIILLISLIEVGYQYPYYWALKRADTSIVVSLFSLGDILTPLFAFLLVGEHLHHSQYVGFFIVTLASFLLTLNIKKLRLNTSLFLMLIVSIILTLQTVLWKYLFEQGLSWSTTIVWKTILQVAIASLFLFVPKNYQEFKGYYKKAKTIGLLFFFNQFLTWGGEVVALFALLVLPASIEKGIGSVQPLFVLLLAFLFAKKLPQVFKEYVGKDMLWRKITLFIVMIIGIFLIIK